MTKMNDMVKNLGLAPMTSGAEETTTFEFIFLNLEGRTGDFKAQVWGDIKIVVDGEYDDIGEWISSLEIGVLEIDELKLDSLDINVMGSSWDESDILDIRRSDLRFIVPDFITPQVDIHFSLSPEEKLVRITLIDLSGVEEVRGDSELLEDFFDVSDSFGLYPAGSYFLQDPLSATGTQGLLGSRESATVSEPSAAFRFLKYDITEGSVLKGDLTNLYIGDFNGDGKDDFIRQEKGIWDNDDRGTAHLFISNGSDFTKHDITESSVLKGDLTNLYISDFNGDLKDDFIRQEKGSWDNDDRETAHLFISANVEIVGGNQNDWLIGTENSETISGLEGNDTLIGGLGNDTLIGGLGNETLIGDGGRDVFVLAASQRQDLIRDFEDGIDSIALEADLSFSDLRIASHGSQNQNTRIFIDETGEVLATLLGIASDRIDVNDFTIA